MVYNALSVRRRAITVAILGVLSLAAASAEAFVVNARVLGNTINVGDINVTAGGTPTDRMVARFTFDPEAAFLDEWYDFQWINVLTGIVGDPSPLFPRGAPAFDPLPPPVNATEDTRPFYYNNTEWNGTFGGVDIHEEGQYTEFRDFPQRGDGNGWNFTTMLVVENLTDPTFGRMTICPLAAFTWTYRGTGDVSAFGMEVPVDTMLLNNALNNTDATTGMFGAWTFDANCDLQACPSPGTISLLTLAGMIAMRRRRG
jgi:hypothetical protein